VLTAESGLVAVMVTRWKCERVTDQASGLSSVRLRRSGTWHSRLGVIVPSVNVVVEHDAGLLLPEGVTLHVSRLKWLDEDHLESLVDELRSAADLLGDAHVRAIAFACTTGSCARGAGYDRELIATIEAASGVRATTTATAVIKALTALGARRIALVSPYGDRNTGLLISFLTQSGFDVRTVVRLRTSPSEDLSVIDPVVIANAARDAVASGSPAIDAVFISCTALRGLEATALLEGTCSVPVISSNYATFWELVQAAGLGCPI